MLQGRFPDPDQLAARPACDAPADSTSPASAVSRRTLLTALGAFVAGAIAGSTSAWFGARAATGSTKSGGTAPAPTAPVDAGASPPPRGTLAWVRALHDADDDELIAAAGDLERARARYRSEPALFVPLFERILVTARERTGPVADMAAACALRSLGRLGRHARAIELSAPLTGRPDLPDTERQRAELLGVEGETGR
ncbi:MAG: hypothetical protein IPM29_00680 [Planctomycetes bacterium]|nr:hypothetical protein [Planctomycetota bacterium]